MAKSFNAVTLDVTFRHTEPTEAIKKHAEQKILSVVEKYTEAGADIHVVLLVEKRDHTAEVNFRSHRFDATARATAPDLYTAIDQVAHTLITQIRKQKEKISDHRPSEVIQEATT